MDSQDSSEPVKVYVRIRPEFEHIVSNDKTTKSNNPLSSIANNCCAVLDAQTVKLIAPDGVYAARKSVSAVDDKIYAFDKIFNENCTQEDIYGDVAEHVLATVRGYNTTIFAYGTTGSGKSYTMTGNKAAPGIIPRAIGDLFRHIENAAAEENDVFFYVRLSYVELYNNNFRNLLEHAIKDKAVSASKSRTLNNSVNMSMNGFFTELDDSSDPSAHISTVDSKFGTNFAGSAAKNTSNFATNAHPGLAHRTDKIEVRESQSAGVFLAGPNLRIPVTSALEAFQLIAKGNKLRATGATACNDVSSRSHAILTFHVESRITSSVSNHNSNSTKSSLDNDEAAAAVIQNNMSSSSAAAAVANVRSELRLGKMHLVDLAGSERLSLSGAEGDTRLETQQINLSLTALGDVLSALSRNATCLAQQQKSLSKSIEQNLNSIDSSFFKQHIPAQVPVPYRNSKLTHLLKDSLGGNSKTVMITTIRTTEVYYQQTAISLMYASRAKKIRNRSLVNRNVIGDTGIHAVSSEIDRLKKSLEERSTEFERLRVAQLMDAQENSALKLRLQEMKNTNDMEKRMLENQVSQVIHSQAGHIASQREKISVLQSALQDELTLSQNRIAEQEKEIKWLKKALDETSLAAQGPHDQLQRMQKMVEAWQSQAKSTHKELSTVLKQAEELKIMNSQLTSKFNESEATKRQLQEEISERTQESSDLSNEISRLLLEQEQLIEANKSADRAYQEAKAVLKEKMEKMVEKEYILKENTKLISTLEKELTISRELIGSNQTAATQTSTKLTSRVKELEKDKNELTSRLNNAISTLEKSTTRVVDDANAKLQVKDSKLKQADEDINLLKNDRNIQKKQLEEYKRLLDTNVAQHERKLLELKEQLKEEKSENAKNAAKIISLDELVQGFRDKILKMKTNEKEYEVKSMKQIDLLTKELREKDRALKMNLDQRDAERITLMTEFERILDEKKQKYQHEIEEAHATAAVSVDKMQAIQKQHRQEIERLKLEFAKREEDFEIKLKETEIQMKVLIDNEIDSNIKQLETKHFLNIQKVKDQCEEELRDAVRTAVANVEAAAHDHHLQVLNEKQGMYQLDKEINQTECTKLLKDSQEESKLQKEALIALHEQNIEKINKTHLSVMQHLEGKITSQCEAYYEEQLKLSEEKQRILRNKEVEKERVKLTTQYEEKIESLNAESMKVKDSYQQSLKNIEYQRELLLQESVDSERSRLLLLNKEKLDEQRVSFTKTFHEQLHEQADELTTKFTKQIEKERQLVMGEQEKYLQEQSLGKQKKIDLLVLQIKNTEDHHSREMDLLENKYKKETLDFKKEFEVLHRVQASEHERALFQLREELSQVKIEQQEYIQKCLADQQRELLDRNRNESIKLRLEMQDMEVRHQDELSAALQDHVLEMTKQRKIQEAAHTQYIETLQEELASTKERYNGIMAQTTVKESRDSNTFLEQKTRFEESLRKAIEVRDRKHQLDLEAIENANSTEVKKAKTMIAKLKTKHLEDISIRELELERENQQVLKDLQEKHSHLIADLKNNYEQKIKIEIEDNQTKIKANHLRIYEESKERELTYQLEVTEAEQKIRELTQTLQKQKQEFQEEQFRLIEDKKNIQLLVQSTQAETSTKMETLQNDLENRIQSKHQLQIKLMQDKFDRDLNKLQEDSQALLVKKEVQYQREVALLKKITEDQEASNMNAMEDLQFRYKQLVNTSTNDLNKVLLELETIKTSSSNEVNRLQSELAASKNNYEDELQRALKLYTNSADLVIHHKQDLQHLQDEINTQKEYYTQKQDKQVKEHQFFVEELLQKNSKDMQKLKDEILKQNNDFQHQKNKMIEDHDKEITVLKDSFVNKQNNFDLEISQLKIDFTDKLQHLQDKLTSYIQQNEKHIIDHQLLVADHDKEITVLKDSFTNKQNNFDLEISRLNDALVEKQIEFVNQFQDHDKQLLEMKELHVSSIEMLSLEHEKQQLKLHDEITSLQNENKVQVNNLNNKLQEDKEHLLDLEKLLVKERELCIQREEDLKEDLNTMKAQGQADVYAERVLKANEIDELKTSLALTHKTELKNLHNKLEVLEVDKNSTIQRLQEELSSQAEAYQLELAVINRRNNALLKEYSDEKGSEMVSIQRQLVDKDEEKRDIQRHLVKSEAIREVLKQDTENMRLERQQLREKVHALEMEIIEHGKSKFETRILAEKDRIEQTYKQVMDELKQEVLIKINENKNLSTKLEDTYNEIANIRSNNQANEEERDRVESMFRTMLAEKDATYEMDVKRALETQQQELQGGYLKLIQQQVESLMEIIQKQVTQTTPIDDLQEKFLSLVQDLPDFWQKKHGNGVFQTLPIHPLLNQTQSIDLHLDDGRKLDDSTIQQSTNSCNNNLSFPRTPLHILGQSARDHDNNRDDDNIDNIRRSRFGGRQSLPWSSPSLRSSPTDQLIAAILDGDVQGIRAVVRSKGEDLKSEFWKELARSVLPLHRAVSGLHFHGSEKLLVATIEALAQLGADINATDHAGNSVLHKAIQVCTSKSVSAVVNTLLQRGANPSLKNKDGDFPLHSECKRIRSASVEVIESLVAAGADPNVRNSSYSASVTPLTLVLLRGAASTSIGVRLIGSGDDLGLNLKHTENNATTTRRSNSNSIFEDSVIDFSNTSAISMVESDRNRGVAGKRVWIKAAEMLLKAGANFDRDWRTQKGCTQLHLLLASFPPSREDSSGYRKVLKAVLDHGLDVFAIEEEYHQNALFILCEQMALTSSDVCPDAPRLIHLLLRGSYSATTSNQTIVINARKLVNSTDRSGRVVLDIIDKIEHSCLSASKSILRDASQGIIPTSTTDNTNNNISSSTNTASAISHNNHIYSSSNNEYWEVDQHRPRISSSAIISNISAASTTTRTTYPSTGDNGRGNNYHNSTATTTNNSNHIINRNHFKGEAELKSKTSHYSSTDVSTMNHHQDVTATDSYMGNTVGTNTRLALLEHSNSMIDSHKNTNNNHNTTTDTKPMNRNPSYFYPNNANNTTTNSRR